MVNLKPRLLYPEERGTVSIYTNGWVGLMAGLDGCRKSPPRWVRTPDGPARSQSLYRLSYHSNFHKGNGQLLSLLRTSPPLVFPKFLQCVPSHFDNQSSLEPEDSTGCPYGAGAISIFEKNSEIIRPFRASVIN